MRLAFAIASSLLVAACPSRSKELTGADDSAPPDPNMSRSPCSRDADCELAGRTCCDCPTFALSFDDPKLDACRGVVCPPSGRTCSAIHAVCERNECKVACSPVVVTQSCETGFASDSTGCLIDACAQLPAPTCELDSDCVQTRADCCGCARGGADTAVPLAMRAAFDENLGCTGEEACPEANICDSETPQCAQGSCKLVAGTLPDDACGRPDLAACPDGQACTVNASDPANMHGVGVCR
ncbi:MAG TPA: hypothetical protein VK427_03100 [Kofleriaceae bacterium]|nr:hypothetical protein [Kofleriaceae bacterium]